MKYVKPIAFCIFTLLSTALFSVSAANAATIKAASCSQSNVQTAINSAADGDTVSVPAGSCAWSSAISWTDRNVAVIGAGKDATTISCPNSCFSIISNSSTSAYSKWRISNMTLQGPAPGSIKITIWDNHTSWHTGWRIDHMKFNFPGAGSGYGIFVGGPTYGLIDHNDWIWGNGMAILVSSQMSSEYPPTSTKPQGGYLDSQPLDMGTANALYVEDNTFTSTVGIGCAAYDTSSGGGRVVFRHNILTGCMFYSHWTRSAEIGGILAEIYNNQFIGNSAYNSHPIRLESGTGVIFNNTMQMADNYAWFDERRGVRSGYGENSSPFGACDGTKTWDGNAGDPAAPGWPCLGQIGRSPGQTMAQIQAGNKQVSAPIYLWNNGAQVGCSTGGPCTNSFTVSDNPPYVKATPHPNGEVDYVLNRAKPGYTPFTYPHPLASGKAAPAITSASTASGKVGSPFSYTITATNSPTSFKATGLPAGLSVNTATGVISGTPAATGTSSVALSATNAAGTGSATLTLTVSALTAPAITSPLTANGKVGLPFSYTITATNSPTSFKATGLPAGLSVNTATGVISGTPAAAGTSSFTVSATNASGTGSAILTLTINAAAAPPAITSALSASGKFGSTFSYAITATNNPASFKATGLPAGLAVNTATGVITGTPAAAGTSSVALSATNAAGTGSATLALTIDAAGISTLFSGTVTSIVVQNDPNPVELGVKFYSARKGQVTGVKFYKNPRDTGTHTAHLWSSPGKLLASATFAGETASGWQSVKFANPVAITAGTRYIASYHSNGNYSETDYFFTKAHTNGPLTAPRSGSSGGNSVYAYGSAAKFPASSWRACNYWVDVMFK